MYRKITDIWPDLLSQQSNDNSDENNENHEE